MLWATFWALVLGFGASGAIQAFAPRATVRRSLGDHRPAAVARATFYGMASSSCSFAAAASARALVLQGADFISGVVFMVASTNLVVELGIVLLALAGWQFLVGEFVGGAIMICCLVAIGALWLRGRAQSVGQRDSGERAVVGEPGPDGTQHPMPGRLSGVRTRQGWAEAAGYAVGDLRMLAKEMVLGFVVAGFLSELVPQRAWASIFLSGHGAWTSIENALMGPLVAMISFVCSVGNVPLAVALWHGGVGFGGVMAFIFGDLITIPLILVYRKQYGRAMALRLTAALWLAMSAAGLATEGLFGLVGWLPPSHHSTVVNVGSVGWDWTTYLDIAAATCLVGLLWLALRGRRDSTRVAVDPVCGMQVDMATAPARTGAGPDARYFCSEGCRDHFLAPGGTDAVPPAMPAAVS